jgi:photosystem II stability/assembly factor-like uncharacterized protein
MKKTLLLLLAGLLPVITFALQWVPCNKPLGGTVMALASYDNNIWVGTEAGGIYRSADNGQNWIPANNGLLNDDFQRNIKCLHPMANRILAGTAIGLFYRDNATSPWMPTNITMNQVLCMTSHNGYVISGFYGYVARTTDGINWTTLPGTGLPTPNTFAVRHIASTQGALIISTLQAGSNLYKSANNGDTWSVLASPPGIPANTGADYLGMAGNRLFVYYYTYGLYYSDDAGQTWHSDLGNGTAYNLPGNINICNGQYVFGSGQFLHTRPITGGTNWAWVFQGLEEVYPLLSITLKHNGYLFVGTSFEGMYRIDTMLTNFEKINTGLVATKVQVVAGNGNRVIAHPRRQNRIWSSIDNGQNWAMDSITNYYVNDVTSSTINGNKWYLGVLGGVNLSTDGGATWKYIPTGMANLNPLAMTTTSSGDVYAGTYSGKLYKSINDTAWQEIPTTISSQEDITEILEVGQYIFIGTKSAFANTSHLYRTNSTFQNLQIVSTSWNADFENVCGLAYQGNRLIAGSSGYGTFYSTDFGNTWDTVNTGLVPYNVFNDMVTFEGRVYATRGTESGLYMLDSNSMEWECLTCNAGDPRAISVYLTDTTLYVGTADNGVWKTHVPVSVNKVSLAKRSNLLAYPNPGAAPYIQLGKNDISLPATLCVYDEVGKLCYKELISTYHYQLKQPLLRAGNYIIRITDKENKEATVKWQKTVE